MSKTTKTVTLLELLPENLRSDPDIIAASAAADKEFQEIAQKVGLVMVMTDIDSAPGIILDHLAIQMRIDFYDTAFPIETKRRLVKSGYLKKYTKGTPYAVQQIIQDVFGNGEIIEWFEYEGEPYSFMVKTDALAYSEERIEQIVKLINTVKNLRSWLEKIFIEKTKEMELNIALGHMKGTVVTSGIDIAAGETKAKLNKAGCIQVVNEIFIT